METIFDFAVASWSTAIDNPVSAIARQLSYLNVRGRNAIIPALPYMPTSLMALRKIRESTARPLNPTGSRIPRA